MSSQAAGHAVRAGQWFYFALEQYYQQTEEPSGLRVNIPMEVCVDGLGYRVTAQPLLDLERPDLAPLYGSANGGHAVFADSAIHTVLQEVARDLHLAVHLGAKSTVRVACATDIEARRVKSPSNHVYLLDMARGFPPSSPGLEKHLARDGQPVFYRMLRPEFLQGYKQHSPKTPLSPDALTCFTAPSESDL